MNVVSVLVEVICVTFVELMPISASSLLVAAPTDDDEETAQQSEYNTLKCCTNEVNQY